MIAVSKPPHHILLLAVSAGLILGISTYRDTSESSIPIFGCITILRYISSITIYFGMSIEPFDIDDILCIL